MKMVANDDRAECIAAVRAFNRFYTLRIGVLGEGLLDSPYSLTEVRVLYELAARDGVTAAALARDLRLDPAYLSRIAKRFRAEGLIDARPSPQDRRERALHVTAAGRAVLEPLIAASDRRTGEMLAAYDEPRRRELLAAMRRIETIMGEGQESAPWLMRGLRPGDIGWIIRRHGVLYTGDYGWNAEFEGFVAEIAGAFVKSHDPRRESAWVAERDGEIVGSVFVMRADDHTAKLRLLYVEPTARGLGIGRRLVEQCLNFARDAGYTRMTLWTNHTLTSARRIYEAAGFKLTAEEPHDMFGPPLVGQTWEKDIRRRS
jgi:DNA-binding MarR family transcriptional regulator/predicted GNAT family acetyltransferase